MQLTQYTDYSLRVLIYLSLKKPGELGTISQISEFYGISRNHLVKVVHNLAIRGFIHTIRGKHGGMHLARLPAEITIGEVVRQTEPDFDIAECFDKETNHCVITPVCALKSILGEARNSFLKELDRHTIADAISKKNVLTKNIKFQLNQEKG
ncbi:Rrf2 family transcriptional regulator [Sulfurirhabdus autotrophica]|uniref:BadM/Rrf2 family transcriptional regulator n=1 Tax=Sulfurirhabdus autotrophica TaxID=1706046 RepID=A0A4R3XYL9_9PROT|nr:Rrf2 family transcriptional regulator [Sulfurirhabdus autotrophica]TCV84167.1 BadM/Rrf2 family transcriptional regulator [Sulfurirhabdus autotrophica]